YISGWPEAGRRWRLYLQAVVEGKKAEDAIYRVLGSCGATIAARVLRTTGRPTAAERCLMAAYPGAVAAPLVEGGRRGRGWGAGGVCVGGNTWISMGCRARVSALA